MVKTLITKNIGFLYLKKIILKFKTSSVWLEIKKWHQENLPISLYHVVISVNISIIIIQIIIITMIDLN